MWFECVGLVFVIFSQDGDTCSRWLVVWGAKWTGELRINTCTSHIYLRLMTGLENRHEEKDFSSWAPPILSLCS